MEVQFTGGERLWVLAVLALVVVVHLVRNLLKKSPIPDSLPWVGKAPSDGLFAETRACFKSFTNARSWMGEGYKKYSQRGKSYILPDFSGRPEIIVPNSQLRWLVENPDNVSSVSAAHYEMLEGEYAFLDPHLLQTVFHEHVVHRNLARRLAGLIPGTWEEVCRSINETWGNDSTSWRPITAYPNMMRTIARASNRMFVGLPLCRNESYLSSMSSFSNDIMITIALMRFVPDFLRPIFGRIFSIPNWIHWRKTLKYTMPLIKQRVADLDRKRQEPDWKWEAPDDYVTWHIQQAWSEGKEKEMRPDMVAKYLMPINFAAIHTTTLTITMTLYDLLSSDPSKRFVEGLREEAGRVFKEEGCVWTKQGLNRLVRIDSAIRESMRLSGFATKGVTRKIVAKEGMQNKDEGWTAPYGAFVSVDVRSMHLDPEVYPSPTTYDAFRFSRQREEYEKKAPEDKDEKEILKLKQMGMITTGETFLPFGHGRHACPGRFFVNHELKMMFAYMLINYDIQYVPERPQDVWLGQMVLPDMKAQIQVRRRPGSSGNGTGVNGHTLKT
ncbi:MAG: hypothetical protein M1820_003083 [Bogoriella megaspora]|nr:MAG: hypothetical protein M1820_003083 [Bogoriella megaspora]